SVPPTAVISGASAPSIEGTTLQLTSVVTDPSAADTAAGFTYAWSATKDGTPFAAGNAADFRFTPDDNGVYVVTLRATDKDGGTGTDGRTITVLNVAATLGPLAGPALGVRGELLAFAASLTDPGTKDTHTAVIDWGDGHSSPGI